MGDGTNAPEKKKSNGALWALSILCLFLALGVATYFIKNHNAENALKDLKEEQRQSQAAKTPAKPAAALAKPDNLSGVVPDQPPVITAPTLEDFKKLEARVGKIEGELDELRPCLDKLCAKKPAPVVKKSGKRGPAVSKTAAPNLVPPQWKHCDKPDGPRTARDFEAQEPCANCPK